MLATATMSSKGQVTIPRKVRQQLGVGQGDQLVFVEEDGRFYIENPTVLAFTRLQQAMVGEAERLGLKSEDDVVDMIKEMRRERWEASHARDA